MERMTDEEKDAGAAKGPDASSQSSPQGGAAAAPSPAELARALRARSSGELSAQKLPSGISITPVPDAAVAATPEVSPEEDMRDIARALGATEIERPSGVDGALPRVRTYKSDLAGAVRKKKVSLLGMVAAESDRAGARRAVAPETAAAPGPAQRWRILGIAALALLSAAALGAIFLIPPGPEEEIQRTYAPAPVFTNAETRLTLGTDAGRTMLRRITEERDAAAISLGEVQHVRLLNADLTEISAQELFSRFSTRVPQELVRALYGTAMTGFHAFDRTQPFFIVPVASYENAFSGMLAWERYLREDLSPLFDPQRALNAPGGAFRDKVIRNLDARVLSSTDALESVTLLYAFPDKGTLIITTNDATLREILARLAATKTNSKTSPESNQ
jgi:hypothetical protein